MYNRLDEPKIKLLLDVENLDTKYLDVQEAYKILRFGQTSLKYYITTYELVDEGKVTFYYKKEDIRNLTELKEKVDEMRNLMPILNISSDKTLKRFFEKYKIRYLRVDTHPFNRANMYYKEDLEIIKEKFAQYSKERFKDNRIKYKGYYDKAIEIEHFHINEYYTRREAVQIFMKHGFNKTMLYNTIQPYLYNDLIYLKKSEVNYWINKSNDFIKCTEAKEILNYNSVNGLVDILKRFDIKILDNSEHPYGAFRIMRKEDVEKVKRLLHQDINLDDYLTMPEVRAFLGVCVQHKRIEKFVEPIIIRGTCYYKKKDICEIKKYITDTIRVDDLFQKYLGKIGKKTIINLLKENNIRVISYKEHPFAGGALVFKKDLEEINNIIEFKLKLDSSESRKKKFELLISQIPKREYLEQTLEDFNNFAVERLNNKPSDNSLHVPLFKTYALLCDILQKNLYEYSDEDIQRFISIIYNDERVNSNVKIEFVYFCNFTNKKYRKNILPYKLNQGDLYNITSEKRTYSREQILDLFGLLYSSLNDRVYLNKALNHRGYAMVWLYMYMHYVVFWRTSTLQDIPKPNLRVIGFNSGEEFLNWCKEPNNIFTEDMGVKICTSVKMQIDSLRVTAKKNGQPLVFEYGRLMSRGLGLLLAICEAHRQCIELNKIKRNDRLYRRHDTDRLITSNYNSLDNYKGLFGEKYTNIIGEEVFSNLAMERAFNNYTLDYFEENDNAIGAHILSIMRSHVVDSNGVSNTTPIYETRVKEGTIGDIVATLEEIGAFGFAKHVLLNICDEDYKVASLTNKNKKIVDLTITPNQAEGLVKVVAKQRERVTKLLVKMILNPDTAKLVLKELTFGNDVAGKHEHSRCLLKAMLNLNDDKIDDKIHDLDLGTDEKKRKNCLMPSAGNCFSCPFLIGQIFLLYELGDVISDSIRKIKSSKNDFERLLQSTLIFESYLPILYEAQEVLGNKMVSNYIDLDCICNDLTELEVEGKLLLKE